MKVIDIHTHGIGGFDTFSATEEQMLQIAEIHGSHGVSEIILTVYSATLKTMRENMRTIKNAMKMQMDSEGKAAHIAGIHLEGPFLNSRKCGALDPNSFIRPNEFNLIKLIEGYEDVVKIITIAPELEKAIKIIEIISDLGIIASMGHSEATYFVAEAGYNAGARGITHIFNAMRGIHHRDPGIAGFGVMNKDIYIEVIADPFHLDSRMIEFIFSVKNHERIIIVSDTVKGAKKESGTGGVTDNSNKLLGGSMTNMESADRLIKKGFNKDVILKCISENPERYLHGG
ncbi:MAG: hypothetical protein ABFR82_15060 [Nitrospirota bacterium]